MWELYLYKGTLLIAFRLVVSSIHLLWLSTFSTKSSLISLVSASACKQFLYVCIYIYIHSYIYIYIYLIVRKVSDEGEEKQKLNTTRNVPPAPLLGWCIFQQTYGREAAGSPLRSDSSSDDICTSALEPHSIPALARYLF